jgi:hypothetical protein
MNRELRRAEKRLAKAKPNRSRAIYVTNFQLEFESFDTIERLFVQLRHGAIEYVGGKPIIMGLHGEHYEMLPAMEGWLKYWQELAAEHDLEYDDGPLLRLCKSLEYGKPLLPAEIEAAYAVVGVQRRYYRTLPKSVTTAMSRQVVADIQRTDEIRNLMRAT